MGSDFCAAQTRIGCLAAYPVGSGKDRRRGSWVRQSNMSYSAAYRSKPTFRTVRQVDLAFKDWRPIRHLEDPLQKDLSAVALIGRSLFLACDETASIERLTRLGKNKFGSHDHTSLGDFFDLPGGSDGEMDIEGLAASEGYLWIVGSHSLKRSKPKRDDNDRLRALKRMEDIDRDSNRYFLGRVPLEEQEDGVYSLVKATAGRQTACLKIKRHKGALTTWLKGDPPRRMLPGRSIEGERF